MLTFKQFLFEDGKVPDLSMFKRNAATMLEKNIWLYRGTNTIKSDFKLGNDDEEFSASIGKQRTIERHPKGSAVSARLSKNWDIPNRALSAFVTRSVDHAISFGHLMLVVPSDNVEMYGWSKTDFNLPKSDQFREQLQTLEYNMTRVYGILSNLDTAIDNPLVLRLKTIMQRERIKSDDIKEFLDTIESSRSTEFFDTLLNHANELHRLNDDAPMWFIRLLDYLDETKQTLDKLSMDSVAEMFAEASKETFELITFKNLEDIPKVGPSYDELWFTGDFLSVYINEYSDDIKGQVKSALKAILK